MTDLLKAVQLHKGEIGEKHNVIGGGGKGISNV